MASTRRLVSLAASHAPRRTPLALARPACPTKAAQTKQRGLATAASSSGGPSGGSPGGARVGTVFWTLVGAGIAATSYGLYSYLDSFRTWPAELRPDLRAALKAQRAGDVRRAEAMYRQ